MIPKKPALGLDPGAETGFRTGLNGISLQTYQQNQFSYETRIETKRKRPKVVASQQASGASEEKRKMRRK